MAAESTNEFTTTEGAASEQETSVAMEPQRSDAAAEAAASEKMNEIFGRNDARNQADELEEEGLEGPDNPDGDAKPEAKEEEKDGTTEPPDEEEEKPVVEEDDAEKQAKDERQKLLDAFDPNLVRVAKELGGWKQVDIDEFIATNPVLARVTFSNMAAGYNALSLQYAQASRSGVAHPALAQQPPQAVATQQSMSALDELLAKPERLAALSEIAGKELTDAFIKPMLDERKQMVEDRAFIAGLRRDAVIREINDSFTQIAKDGFEEFYGKNGEVTKDQNDNRFRVGQLADQVRAGAQMQGVNMSINEALRRAHLIVTADQTKQQARREVVQQVKKRSTQITARPTARKATAKSDSTSKSDAQALAVVEKFWDEMG